MSLPSTNVLTLQTMTMGAMRVQLVDILGEPWFYAPSLAETLEYRDARDMLRIVPDNEKGTRLVRTLGGVQTAFFVKEPGFYRVVFRSRSEVAEPLKKWVFHEVLPSIRKTGQYRVIQEAKRFGHSMNYTDAQWEWLKERPDFIDVIPLALAGYNSVQITRTLGYKTPSGITARKRIDKLKELGFLPPVIAPRTKQLELRIKAELTQ
jgi:prophage antirepressor-like protein